ncbi:cytochrome c1 [Glacieibacterium sp.]|uniref:cytochrome c1 n=1 Tax=Glacieibacterium sp. TaxID=2860237 RepID=UPI003AFFE3A3
MVRLIAALVGIVFCAALLWGAVLPRDATAPDQVKALHLHPREVDFTFNNPVVGTFDRQQLQRGMQVYKEVCSACHSLNRVAFRNLTDLGFNAAEVKALAKGYDVPSIDDKTGEVNTRKALPSDHFPPPFPNDTAARAANNNALPPDLSLITKAREDGSQYVHSLLAGYKDAPKGWTVPDGLYYNPYFRSLNIAMPPPLTEGQVTYADGTKASVEQMAEDVSAFLTWTAEPKLEARRRTGTGAVLFLIILTVLAYASYQRVWRDVKGKKTATPAV